MPVVTGLVQLAVNGQVLSSSGVQRKVVNVFNYFHSSGVVFPPSRTAFAASFDLRAWSRVVPALSQSWAGVSYTVLFPEIPGDVPVMSGTPANGMRVGGRLPLNLAVYVQAQSGLRGKNYTGSKRFGPVSELDAAGDELNASGQTLWGVAASALPVPLDVPIGSGSEVFAPFIWSRTLSVLPPAAPVIVGALLTNAVPDKTICHWRHRRERVQR